MEITEVKETLRTMLAQMESTRLTPLFLVLFVCMIVLLFAACAVPARKDTRFGRIASTAMSVASAVLIVVLFGMKFAGLDRVPI